MKIMGIDLGVRKVAYSIWEDDLLQGTEAHDSVATSRQLELMDCADFIYEAVHHVRPDYVFIEDTLVGNNVKYSIKLSQMMGAVLLRLAEIEQEIGESFTYQVNVSTWKKEVIGKGNAKKELVQQYLYERDSAYSVLCGSDQDRIDAACIGYYGVLISRRAKQLEELRQLPERD